MRLVTHESGLHEEENIFINSCNKFYSMSFVNMCCLKSHRTDKEFVV